VPLLLLTADRPPELRENGAGQAIDQLKIFGGAAKWFFEVGTHDATPERLRWIRTLACRAYAATLKGRPGVVHLNFPLREPLVTDDPLAEDTSARSGSAPYVRRRPLITREWGHFGGEEDLDVLREIINGAKRGVVVAGRDERVFAGWSPGEAAAAFAAAAGWPLLADPLSGARSGAAAIAHYDALLRNKDFLATVKPDLILRVGDLPVSKPLRNWLAGLSDVRQIALDREAAWQDPDSVLSDSLALDPAAVLGPLAKAGIPGSEGDWLAHWRSGDELAAEAILGVIGGAELSEPRVAAELGVLLPQEATLFVASSMPVRDIETFWPVREDSPRVLCNRGANGIDGIVSSAFGAAAAERGPVVLLIGDVALAHDIGGLLAARRLGLKLTIVLLDNGGGGIFDFLPVAETEMARAPSGDEDLYTRHIATPTGLNFEDAARLYALEHERVDDVADFRTALERALAYERSSIIEVRGARGSNTALHRRAWDAVSEALSSAP
jgi:2-succinyl-5-enolpyruvyl-6-hydroxy-3-cyclohexene-1-carboxylate synthase